MKVIHLSHPPKAKKRVTFAQTEKPKRARRVDVGGSRASFFPGKRLLSVIADLRARYRACNLTEPSNSLIYRDGAFMICRKLNADLKKAQKGELHAKKRKVKFGLH